MAPHHCTTPSAKVATTATLLLEARTAIALAIWGIRKIHILIYIYIKKKHPSSTSIYCQLPRSAPQSSALPFDNRTPRRWESPRLLPCHDCKIWRRFCNLFQIAKSQGTQSGAGACAIESDAFAPPRSHRCTRWIHPLASDAKHWRHVRGTGTWASGELEKILVHVFASTYHAAFKTVVQVNGDWIN